MKFVKQSNIISCKKSMVLYTSICQNIPTKVVSGQVMQIKILFIFSRPLLRFTFLGVFINKVLYSRNIGKQAHLFYAIYFYFIQVAVCFEHLERRKIKTEGWLVLYHFYTSVDRAILTFSQHSNTHVTWSYQFHT